MQKRMQWKDGFTTLRFCLCCLLFWVFFWFVCNTFRSWKLSVTGQWNGNSYLCCKSVHFMQRDWVKTLGLKLISTNQQKNWTEYTSLIAKTTCPGLLDITFFACCYIQIICILRHNVVSWANSPPYKQSQVCPSLF